MNHSIKILLILSLSISNIGFSKAQSYSFFIAGHVYGTPGVDNVGFHPPFKAKFNYIQGREEIKFGVLLGDIVIWPSIVNWDEVDAEIDTLGMPVYFAPGNHDMGNREMYESRYGNPYFSFVYNNDLFIILDPNIDQWNISGEQLEFVQNTVSEFSDVVDNIFVLSHQLIWWTPENIYSSVTLNSTDGRAEQTNFWSEIEPLFHNLSNEVYFCAGDVGAASYASSFMYDNYDNISYIATGMGKNVDDNFIVINVDASKNVSYDFICLNTEELFCFGDLEDYEISDTPNIFADTFSIYPNPAIDFFTISTGIVNKEFDVLIYTSNGKIVYSAENLIGNNVVINADNMPSGLYFVKCLTNDDVYTKKFIVAGRD